jgi:hypothetical protein
MRVRCLDHVLEKVRKAWHEPTLQYFLSFCKLCPTQPRSHFRLLNFYTVGFLSLFFLHCHIPLNEPVPTSANHRNHFLLLVLWLSLVLLLLNRLFEESLFGHSTGEVLDVRIESKVEFVLKVFSFNFEQLKMMLFVLFLIFINKLFILFFPDLVIFFGLGFLLFFLEIFFFNVLIKFLG